MDLTGWRALSNRLASLRDQCVAWLGHSADANTDASDSRSGPSRRDEASRAAHEIKRLKALDAGGREYVVLEIVPLERHQTYHGIRVERGQTRYELNDGAPLTPRGDGTFEVNETKVQLRIAPVD